MDKKGEGGWSFYFCEVFEQLKTFHLERILRFLSMACNFLRNTTFTWWPRELSRRDRPCIWESVNLMFMGSSRDDFKFAQLNSLTDVAVGFRPPSWFFSAGQQHGVSIQKSSSPYIHLVCEKLTDLYLLTDFDFSFRWPAALMGRNAKPVIHVYPRTANA